MFKINTSDNHDQPIAELARASKSQVRPLLAAAVRIIRKGSPMPAWGRAVNKKGPTGTQSPPPKKEMYLQNGANNYTSVM